MANRSIKQELTADRLRELLNYDRETGTFTWVHSIQGTKAGAIAGTSGTEGRRHICIDYIRYKAHRLAWLYVYGKWPDSLVDHINGIPYDNRIHNLRDVGMSDNLYNQKRAHKNNRSGLLGVTRIKHGFAAKISVSGKASFLGHFDTAELAHAAYMSAKSRLHGIPGLHATGFGAPSRRSRSDGTESRLTGIRLAKRAKGVDRWEARISIGGTTTHLGTFDTKELAVAARVKAGA